MSIFASFQQVLDSDFVGYDDNLYVTDNEDIKAGFSAEGVIRAFTTYQSANWHPLTMLSHMLDCQLYGLNPKGHHLSSLLLHIANSLLLFIVLYKMTGGLWQSAFVAALFGLHPLHVESVAWVSERKDVLCTFFGLLAIGAYHYYVKQKRYIYYLAVFLFLSVGLMAKPMLVTLPFVLLLLDFWPYRRFDFYLKTGSMIILLKRILILATEKTPLFIPVIISSILTIKAQQSIGAVESFVALPMIIRIANAFNSYAIYAVKMVLPYSLSAIYPHTGSYLPLWQAVCVFSIIIGVVYIAIRSSKQYPYLLTGLFWYLGTLVPVIGIIQVGSQGMADRYTYIPMTGLFIIVAWGGGDIIKSRNIKKGIIAIAVTLVFVGMAVKTYSQVLHWKNGITLFEQAVKNTKNNWLAHNNLGSAYFKAGNFEKAVFHYSESLKINPYYASTYYNLGTTFSAWGRTKEAIVFYKEGVRLKPVSSKTHYNLANLMYKNKRYDEAAFHFGEVIRIDPDNADAHNNMAYMLITQNMFEKAAFHCRMAIKINPHHSNAHFNFGRLLEKQGKLDEAIVHFKQTIRIDPGFSGAYYYTGLILVRQEKYKEAAHFFSKALKVKPDFIEAQQNLDKLIND
ncbi:MAG: tetratricopeptide repeat protein [Desulfobacterales bacterium]|nr:tetratricopeptide repeat protein [Desulfobacteraceae bacterium]MBT7084631.1 tetratricopeptide repeat protein [Desulfobacterales bacterium]MBT7697401.1 tetratricopeptide repeat protein [Desulfobacterales bacterium]